MNVIKTAKLAAGGFGVALMLSAAMAVPAFAAEEVTTMATTDNLNLRNASSLDGAILATMPAGTSVPVYGMTQDGWYHVKYNDMEGFCYYRWLNFEGSEEGTVHDGKKTMMYATAPLNVRVEPNTNCAVIGSLAVDEGVQVISKHDGWFKVNFNGTDAYCYGEYLGFGQGGYTANIDTVDTGNTMNKLTTTAPLNVRTDPSMNGMIIGSFAQGETVSILAQEGDWYKVKYHDTVGWSHAGYFE